MKVKTNRRTARCLAMLPTLALAIGAAGFADASPVTRGATTPMDSCRQLRDRVTWVPGDPGNVTISNETKEPTKWLTLQHDEALLIVSQADAKIDTSPGQIFFPNGAWDANGNGRAAPTDWLVPGANQFSVSLEGLSRPFSVGSKSECIRWAGQSTTVLVNAGLNVVQSGSASPLTNRWTGSIGVGFVHFTA